MKIGIIIFCAVLFLSTSCTGKSDHLVGKWKVMGYTWDEYYKITKAGEGFTWEACNGDGSVMKKFDAIYDKAQDKLIVSGRGQNFEIRYDKTSGHLIGDNGFQYQKID